MQQRFAICFFVFPKQLYLDNNKQNNAPMSQVLMWEVTFSLNLRTVLLYGTSHWLTPLPDRVRIVTIWYVAGSLEETLKPQQHAWGQERTTSVRGRASQQVKSHTLTSTQCSVIWLVGEKSWYDTVAIAKFNCNSWVFTSRWQSLRMLTTQYTEAH